MIKRIKKELYEINNYKEHMDFVPQYSLNPKDNFDEIVKLTTRTNVRFKVNGNYRSFIIQAQSDNISLSILICIILGLSTVLLYQNLTDPFYWVVELGILTGLFLLSRYYPSSNNIEINTYDKTIKINSNNLIGKYIIPGIVISFNDFKRVTFKEKSSGEGGAMRFNRIYICYSDQTRSLIDLPNGPFYYVNHKIFMECLTRIIKNGA
jgi:hypothetical protein